MITFHEYSMFHNSTDPGTQKARSGPCPQRQHLESTPSSATSLHDFPMGSVCEHGFIHIKWLFFC